MSNDIDLYSNNSELAPYSPSQPLAPAPDWGNPPDNREIDTYTRHTGGGQVVFGQPLPAGVSIADMQGAFHQLSIPFIQDFTALKHKPSHIQAAVSWLMNALTNPPQQQRQRHSYNLYEHKADPAFQAFANYAHDHAFSAKMVKDCCWWVTEMTKRLNSQQLGVSHEQPRMAPTNSSADPTGQLNDAQYNILVKHNEAVKAQTMGILRDKWGPCFTQNIALAQAHLEKMTPVERQHFDRWTGSFPWVHALNSVEVLVGLFEMSIGSASIPTNGASIDHEIKSIENVMKTERKKYLADSALQARYRQLLTLRGH